MRDTDSSAGPARSSEIRRLVIALVTACSVVLVAAMVLLWGPVRAQSAPFAPSEADGHITGAASLDDDLPAIAKLDPALLGAMREAAAAASHDGISFDVTSGWRSREFQQWLLDEAVASYGSEEVARQFVATPDASSHVTGNAVDIGPIDAQSWLIEHGSQWGICQIYANERWHFQVATSAGGECPPLRPDAAG